MALDPRLSTHLEARIAQCVAFGLEPEELPGIATALFEAGYESTALAVLAGGEEHGPRDARDLFASALRETGLNSNPREARKVLIRHYCEEMLAGRLPPCEAAILIHHTAATDQGLHGPEGSLVECGRFTGFWMQFGWSCDGDNTDVYLAFARDFVARHPRV